MLMSALFSSAANADVEFTVTADKTSVGVGEPVRVTAKLTTDKAQANLQPPSLQSNENFSVLRTSRNQHQSSSIQLVNGKMTKKEEITYLFYYDIAPKTKGTFTFPSLTASFGGKQYQSRPFRISVSDAPVEKADVYVRVLPRKRTMYAGEQILLDLEIRQKAGSNVDLNSGGLVQAVDQVEDIFGKAFSLTRLFGDRVSRTQRSIDGQAFHVFTLPFSLTAHRSGTHRMQAVTMQYDELHQSRGRSRDPFFDGFFGGSIFGGMQRVTKTAVGNSVTMTVRELPSPPARFSGAVGSSFALTADVNPRELPAGEALTIKVALRGNARPGNLGKVALPSTADFEVFTPEEHTYIDTSAQGISTRKTYEYLAIPREKGNKSVPEIQYIYFDPSAETYKTLTAGPFPITVTPGKEGDKPQTRYLTQEEIQEVGRDIRYIKTDVKLKREPLEPHRNPLFFVMFPIPLLLAFFSTMYRVQAQQREKNQDRASRKKALNAALREASRLSSEKLPPDQLTDRTSGILFRYISNRFGFSAYGKTHGDLKTELVKHRVPTTVADSVHELLEQLDGVRFGGLANAEAAAPSLADKLQQVLTELEKHARKGKRK